VDAFEGRITLSVLDRLTDHAPGSPQDPPFSRLQAMRALKAALWRDLTFLLNTRRREEEVPEEFNEANQSLLTFGLPDFSRYSLKNPSDVSRLRRAIEGAIRRFEPRLEKVTVAFDQPEETAPALHFRVDALLRVDPAPEPVSFETLLQPDSGHIVVVGEDR